MSYSDIASVKAVLERKKVPYSHFTDNDFTSAIQLADALINSFCARHFRDEYVTEAVWPSESSWGCFLLSLKHWPIVEIQSVKSADDEDLSYDIVDPVHGILRVYSNVTAIITYKYNDEIVPIEIQAISAEVASNILKNPPDYLSTASVPAAFSIVAEGSYLTPFIRLALAKYSHRLILR